MKYKPGCHVLVAKGPMRGEPGIVRRVTEDRYLVEFKTPAGLPHTCFMTDDELKLPYDLSQFGAWEIEAAEPNSEQKAKWKKEGRCEECGDLLPMSIWGLGDCPKHPKNTGGPQ